MDQIYIAIVRSNVGGPNAEFVENSIETVDLEKKLIL